MDRLPVPRGRPLYPTFCRTLPNVHIKTSLLTALMQTDNIGKPPAVITTKYSVRQRSNTLTKLP
jgi:hypothetical protein